MSAEHNATDPLPNPDDLKATPGRQAGLYRSDALADLILDVHVQVIDQMAARAMEANDAAKETEPGAKGDDSSARWTPDLVLPKDTLVQFELLAEQAPD